MSLRAQAQADLATILGDPSAFGNTVRITDPTGAFFDVVAQTTDVSRVMDPQTGIAVSGNAASIVVSHTALVAVGAGVPVGIPDTTQKPWVVEFTDARGTARKFKVVESMPDRELGCYVLILESYL